MISLDSDVRFAGGQDPRAVVRLASDTGFQGLAIGRRAALSDVTALIPEALASGLELAAVCVPLPSAPLAPNKRLPQLCAPERDERDAAIELCRRVLDETVPFGAKTAIVNMGIVPLAASVVDVVRAHARRELEDDAADLLDAIWSERRARSAVVVDACRFSLDRLLRDADRHGLALAVDVAAYPWAAPGPRELLSLLEDYRGAAVSAVADDARLAVLAALGASVSAERRAALGATATVRRANEPVGIELGYLPGLGDSPEGMGAAGNLTSGAPRRPPTIILTGRPDSRDGEVARARELVLAREIELSSAQPTGSPG